MTQETNAQDAIATARPERVTRKVETVRSAVREDVSLIGERLGDRIDDARDTIRDEPQRATLYALGIGVLIGLLLSR